MLSSSITKDRPSSAKHVETFSKEHRERLAMGGGKKNRGPSAARHKARITVVVRKRPLTPIELSRSESDILRAQSKDVMLVDEPRKNVCGQPYSEQHSFSFDRVYMEDHSNRHVRSKVNAVFSEGAHCSCFAYGQTGSGKTFTVVGTGRMRHATSNQESPGLLEYAAEDCFKWLASPQFDYHFGLYINFFEIYCNKVYDLLNDRRLVKALETKNAGAVVVKDITTLKVTDVQSFVTAIRGGLELRVVGKNSKNADSSRGHAVLTLEVKNEHSHNVFGKLAFIDLAGSERGADAMFSGKQTQTDGAGINRSLLALKECIRALDQQSSHVPFRDSELTKVLRDMFIGSGARTVMLACVSPSTACCEQTLNTLRYAERKLATFTSIITILGGGIHIIQRTPRMHYPNHLFSVKAIRRNCDPDVDTDNSETNEHLEPSYTAATTADQERPAVAEDRSEERRSSASSLSLGTSHDSDHKPGYNNQDFPEGDRSSSGVSEKNVKDASYDRCTGWGGADEVVNSIYATAINGSGPSTAYSSTATLPSTVVPAHAPQPTPLVTGRPPSRLSTSIAGPDAGRQIYSNNGFMLTQITQQGAHLGESAEVEATTEVGRSDREHSEKDAFTRRSRNPKTPSDLDFDAAAAFLKKKGDYFQELAAVGFHPQSSKQEIRVWLFNIPLLARDQALAMSALRRKLRQFLEFTTRDVLAAVYSYGADTACAFTETYNGMASFFKGEFDGDKMSIMPDLTKYIRGKLEVQSKGLHRLGRRLAELENGAALFRLLDAALLDPQNC